MKKYNSTELIEKANEAYKRIDKQYGFEECSFLEGFYQGYAASVVHDSKDIQSDISHVCPECGYPKLKKSFEDFERCHGCNWTSK